MKTIKLLIISTFLLVLGACSEKQMEEAISKAKKESEEIERYSKKLEQDKHSLNETINELLAKIESIDTELNTLKIKHSETSRELSEYEKREDETKNIKKEAEEVGRYSKKLERDKYYLNETINELTTKIEGLDTELRDLKIKHSETVKNLEDSYLITSAELDEYKRREDVISKTLLREQVELREKKKQYDEAFSEIESKVREQVRQEREEDYNPWRESSQLLYETNQELETKIENLQASNELLKKESEANYSRFSEGNSLYYRVIGEHKKEKEFLEYKIRELERKKAEYKEALTAFLREDSCNPGDAIKDPRLLGDYRYNSSSRGCGTAVARLHGVFNDHIEFPDGVPGLVKQD